MISARRAKHLGATTMFTYSHANTPLGQSERAYYLSYFIISITEGEHSEMVTVQVGGVDLKMFIDSGANSNIRLI